MLSKKFVIEKTLERGSYGNYIGKTITVKFFGIQIVRFTKKNFMGLIRELRSSLEERFFSIEEKVNAIYFKTGYYVIDSSADEYFKKYTLLSYEYYNIGSRLGVNIGDHIQTIAVKSLLKKECPTLPYNYWDRDNLSNYEGEKSFVIMQGWFSFASCTDFIPNNKLFPVFIGMHLTSAAQHNIINFLRYNGSYFKNKTVGCRDKYTKSFFKNLGIDAYFSRCLTLTFPKRDKKETQNNVFIVDFPADLLEYIPSDLRKNAIITHQRSMDSQKIEAYYVSSNDYYTQIATEVLNNYANSAKLVITSALHCAAPCIAMGIPVVVINPNKNDFRYDAIEGIVKIYSANELKAGSVDFSPIALDIEKLKTDILTNLRLSILLEKEGLDTWSDEQKCELSKLRARIENFEIKSN